MDKSFAFRNSELWIEYSHKRYLTLEEIRHRLKLSKQEFSNQHDQFEQTRKFQAIPFQISSIEKLFWYFPSDSFRAKEQEIMKLGTQLYDQIDKAATFKEAFIKNASIEEAITSAIYEGANSSRAKAKQLIAENRTPKNKDEWMLINNYLAMSWVKENHHRKVELDLIQEIHGLVTKNTLLADEANYIGKFRDDRVFVGTHEGIDHQKINVSLEEVIQLTTNNKRYLSGVLKGIILHYFIGYVHPFFDGNGRTARTLFYFKAIKNELKFMELLSISAHLKSHGKRYERAFENAVIHQGDISYFVDFCLDSLLFALKQVEKKLEYLLKISQLKKPFDLSGHQIALLQKMALHKFRAIDIEQFSSDMGKSREIARQELKDLTSKKFLKEEKAGKKFVYKVDAPMLKRSVEKFAQDIKS